MRRLLPFLPVVVVLAAVAVLRPGMLASGAGSWRAQLVLLGVVLWPSFRERTVVEAFPPVADGSVAPVVSATPGPSASAMAVRLAAGRFHGIDHSASGGAAFDDVSGSVMVRFESIDFQGTPKPSVRVVSRGARSPRGGIRLGALKGEHGSFSYRTPAGFDVRKGWTVLVWCDTFDVPIAAADLTLVR